MIKPAGRKHHDTAVVSILLVIGLSTKGSESFANEWQAPKSQSVDVNQPADDGFVDLFADPNAGTSESQSFIDPSDAVYDGQTVVDAESPVPTSLPPRRGPEVKGLFKYNLFGGAPPVTGTRRVMADGEAPETYLVQPGDTLFDICAQLLDEPQYWPKLWALNPEIPNPHFIYPGMSLSFYPGDDDHPPFLEIVTEDDVMPVDKNELVESELVVKDIKGLLMEFTDLPEPEFADPSQIPNLEDLQQDGGFYDPTNLKVMIPVAVYQEEIEPLGRIIMGADGGGVVSEGSQVIIDQDLTIGSVYQVVRPKGEIDADWLAEEFVGYRYQVVGGIRIVSHLPEGLSVGQVALHRLGVQAGDFVVAYKSMTRTVNQNAPKLSPGATGLGGTVVGFEYPFQVLGSEGGFVLIDRQSGNFTEGQYVQISQVFQMSSVFFDTEDIAQKPQPVAIAQVVDVSSDVAVAYIIDAKREIRLGDLVNPR